VKHPQRERAAETRDSDRAAAPESNGIDAPHRRIVAVTT
jgi:hypothetical protein